MSKFMIMIRTAFVAWNSVIRKGAVSTINGCIVPADAAKRVWAINETDAVFVTPASGKFIIPVKAGNWKLHVEATAPYTYVVTEDIVVEKGCITNTGVIKLKQTPQ
ncbi:MAG TPA: hypothetical protein VK489_09650 [Ferruginibacter sp.]|nr:hypothetical protein [Ferruginibacter sp.]